MSNNSETVVVWVLVYERGASSGNDAKVTVGEVIGSAFFLKLPTVMPDCSVAALRKLVKVEMPNNLAYCDAAELIVLKDKVNDNPLEEDANVSGLGKTKDNPVVVVAPPPSVAKRQRIEYEPFKPALLEADINGDNWLDVDIPKLPVSGVLRDNVVSGWLKDGKRIVDVGNANVKRYGEEDLVDVFTRALQPFEREGAGEATMHGPLYAFSLIPRVLLSATVNRDLTDTSTSGTNRADAVCVFRGTWTVWRQEEKDAESALLTAVSELSQMMASWSSYMYGPLDWILGIAVADKLVQVQELRRDGCHRRLDILRMENANDRYKFVKIHVCYARFLLWRERSGHFDKVSPPRLSRNVWHRRTNETMVWIGDNNYVRKKLLGPVRKDGLRSFYDATKNVIGVESLIKIKALWNGWELSLKPVGDDRLPASVDEYRAAVRDVARTLLELHKLGWCHLDVRWPNIVYDAGTKMWMLIDCEYAREIGAPWPEVEFKIRDEQKGDSVGEHTDYYFLGKLIESAAATEQGSDLLADGPGSMAQFAQPLISSNLSARKEAVSALAK